MRKIIAVFLAVLLIAGCTPAKKEEGSTEQRGPDFTYEDLNGKSWSLRKLEGNVVVLYFWTATCHVCLKKIPELQLLVDELPTDARLLMLNANDSPTRVKEIIGDSGLTVLLATIKSFQDYSVAYVPTLIFIDKAGKVSEIHVGPMENEEILALIDDLR